MIRRIQALNFRCLRYVDVELDRFHILVGPNASGKSTLFDVKPSHPKKAVREAMRHGRVQRSARKFLNLRPR